MALAQMLYEGMDLGEGSVGLITYMRTDSVHLAQDAVDSCRSFVTDKFGPDFCPEKPNRYKSRSGAQEAHEAIRPADVTVTPDDVGMNWIVSKNKSDFVGKRSLTRPDIDAPNRKQLVGLKTDAPNIVLEEGLQVTEASGALPDAKSIGYVTSAYWSETIQRSIALAMIEDGRNRIGKNLNVPIGAQKHTVTIVAPAFYDPTGERLDA